MSSPLPSPPRGLFEPTRWSLVLRARGEDAAGRREALEELCRAYWRPLYVFLRTAGRTVEDAEDLVQEFFARLPRGPLLEAAAPERGKFRTLLLMGLRRLDVDAWRASRALKRGGGVPALSLDTEAAEAWLLADRSSGASPEEAFDRAWAAAVMERAWARLRREYTGPVRGAVFEELAPRLTGHADRGTLDAAGARLGLRADTAKKALSRLRHRFGAALRAEVAETVGEQGDAREELGHLLSLFS